MSAHRSKGEKSMIRKVCAAMLLGTALTGTAAAQLAAGGGPISYSADNLEYVDGARQLVLTGEVEIAQKDATLRANKLTLFFAPGASGAGQTVANGDIERIVAEGNVFYLRPDQTARGDRAVYETSKDAVTFQGNVIVANADNVIRGESLVLDIGGGRTTISPGATPGQRVRGVFSARQRP